LNVAYFAPVTFKAFFGKRPAGETYKGIKEAPLAMVIPIMIAAIISVLIGIFPGFMMNFVDMVSPNTAAVAMPQYKPAGLPPAPPRVRGHHIESGEHGGPEALHGDTDETPGLPAEGHSEAVETTHEASTELHGNPEAAHGESATPHEVPAENPPGEPAGH
jgi:hypothetical protein